MCNGGSYGLVQFIIHFQTYYTIFKSVYGSSNEQMLEDLEGMIDQLNSSRESSIIKMKETNDNQLVIATCTPLMRRVLQKIQQSGEMVFVDSSGNVDRHNFRVFLLMTHSCAGDYR